MADLLVILFCLCFGVLFGYLFRNTQRVCILFGKVAMLVIYLLLFILGAGLGKKEEIFLQLPTLGLTSILVSISCSLGSILFLLVLQKYFYEQRAKTKDLHGLFEPMVATLKILCCFFFGIMAARYDLLSAYVYGERYAVYLLWIMIFSVAIGLGAELKAFRVLRERAVIIILVPLLIFLGTVVGAVIIGLLYHGITIKDAIIAGCGMGYYTLPSLLVSKSGNQTLATITLLVNIFRELLAVTSTPFLVYFLGNLTPVAIGGATSMDTSLPVIAKFSGEKTAVVAVFSGTFLTMAVPFIVSLLLYW